MTHGDNRRQIAKGKLSDSGEPGDLKIESYMLCVITCPFGLFIVLRFTFIRKTVAERPQTFIFFG